MNYIIYGELPPVIKKRINKILKERLGEPDDFNVVRFDLDETDPNEIVEEASMLPLGYDKKAVVIDNCKFLLTNGSKEQKDIFAKLVQNSSDEIDIIFVHHSSSIDQKGEVYKAVEEKGQIFKIVNLEKADWPKYIKKYFNDREAQIDNDAVYELYERCDGDINRFMNEADKLILYKNHITLNDITLMIAKPIESDVFQLSNALLRGDNASALEIYRGLKLLGSRSTDNLIPLLGNQFRFLSQINYLHDNGLTAGQIASQLGTSEGRVAISLKNSRKFSKKLIDRVLDDLYNLDYQIKSGQIDRFYGFELFLINFPN